MNGESQTSGNTVRLSDETVRALLEAAAPDLDEIDADHARGFDAVVRFANQCPALKGDA